MAVARDRLGSPVWLLIDTAARRRVLMPIRATSVNAAGALVTPFDAAVIEGAPGNDTDVITEERARSATSYYGLEA